MAGAAPSGRAYTGAAVDKRQRAREQNEKGLCPQCGRPLPGDPVGTGRIVDGYFCSLDCIAIYYRDYYEDKDSRADTDFPPN